MADHSLPLAPPTGQAMPPPRDNKPLSNNDFRKVCVSR
jgi:hypothetical protein